MPDSVAATLAAGSGQERRTIRIGRLSRAIAFAGPEARGAAPGGWLDGLLFLLILLAWTTALWCWLSHYATTLG